MINSLTNHMEAFDFTLWNKRRVLLGLEKGGKWALLKVSQLHSLLISLSVHGFSCNDTVSSQHQCCNHKTKNSETHAAAAHDYGAMLVIGFALQIFNVNAGFSLHI